MKLKLDLHTHCSESTHTLTPNKEVVAKIVAAIKAQGLDGIAVTEHSTKNYGYRVKEIVETYFNSDVMIIPGQEVNMPMGEQIVELYLPNNSTFRFWVHPGYYIKLIKYEDFLKIAGDLQGIELKNGMHIIDEDKVREIAENHDLLILTNSDAHALRYIGEYYNEIDLEELYSRAQPTKTQP